MLRCDSHTMCSTCLYNPRLFSTVTGLCDHHRPERRACPLSSPRPSTKLPLIPLPLPQRGPCLFPKQASACLTGHGYPVVGETRLNPDNSTDPWSLPDGPSLSSDVAPSPVEAALRDSHQWPGLQPCGRDGNRPRWHRRGFRLRSCRHRRPGFLHPCAQDRSADHMVVLRATASPQGSHS